MSSDATKKANVAYTNPAFRAMGIPPLKFPSRNWMLFWSVVTVSVSGILYDKQKQKHIREHYKGIVEPRADKPLDVNVRPRKITVFIAPPPNDYIDTSLKIWRRYIKPILYFAGVDYEVIKEEKQGVIRTEVANRIRSVRKQIIDSSTQEVLIQNNVAPLDEYDPEQAKKFKAEFDYRDIIGIFHHRPKPLVKDEDSLASSPTLSGGVICLGRGAYKEYISGLHEGLLGPLKPLQEPPASDEPMLEPKQVEHAIEYNDKDHVPPIASDDSTAKLEEKISVKEADGEYNDGMEEQKPAKEANVLKPFISPDEYSNVELPQELSLSSPDALIRDPNTNVPILLHQSVLVIPVPNLIGFLNFPERIYRFYQKRYYCESVCSAVTKLVEQQDVRPFNHPQDLSLGIEEEADWPKSWVKEG